MGSFKAAVIQAGAPGFDLEQGLVKVARLASEASADAVDPKSIALHRLEMGATGDETDVRAAPSE